jgi:hypothetical protein
MQVAHIDSGCFEVILVRNGLMVKIIELSHEKLVLRMHFGQKKLVLQTDFSLRVQVLRLVPTFKTIH